MAKTSRIVREAMNYTFKLPSPEEFRERDYMCGIMLLLVARRKLNLAVKRLGMHEAKKSELVVLEQLQGILNTIRHRLEIN